MAKHIPRSGWLEKVEEALADAPIAALLGPRQCGKTTLARDLLKGDTGHYFDLEDPSAAISLEQPMSALGPLRGLVVIDGSEFKHEDAPRPTRSMHTALADLDLDRLVIVYPGARVYQPADRIHVMPLALAHVPEGRRLLWE